MKNITQIILYFTGFFVSYYLIENYVISDYNIPNSRLIIMSICFVILATYKFSIFNYLKNMKKY